MKRWVMLASLGVGLIMSASSWAAANNIALNAPVVIVSGGSNISNPTTSLGVVTDGIFAPEDTAYGDAQSLAVEWGGPTSGGAPATGLLLQINLGENYLITGAIVQADDNDNYLLQYFDETNSTWQALYNVPALSVGYGLRGRPDPDQTTYQPVGPVITHAVRFSAVSGDGGYAVSEIELQGTPAPSPTAPTPGVAPDTNRVVLYWPFSSTNFILQTTANLSPPKWFNVTNGIPITGVMITGVALINTSSAAFFRLQAP